MNGIFVWWVSQVDGVWVGSVYGRVFRDDGTKIFVS